MLIEINRIYVGSGIEKKIMVNTRYIIKMEPLSKEHDYYDMARTLLVMQNFSDDKVAIIYAKDRYDAIKSKITRTSKLQLVDD